MAGRSARIYWSKEMPFTNPTRRSHTLIGLLLLNSLLAGITTAAAAIVVPGSTPELHLILPRGVQRGKEHKLTFQGVRLDNAQEIIFYDKGITATSLKVINQKSLEVMVSVAENCRIGEHVAQVRNNQGLSDFRSVYVGPFERVPEVEPNGSFATAQSIVLDRTVQGVLTAEDIDQFRLELKKGQRLSVEVEAMRLGVFVDPVIELFGPYRDGSIHTQSIAFADDQPLTGQDSFFSVSIPEDGIYLILLRESAFKGTSKSFYRLHVGDFPRPESLFPGGGKPGETIQLNAQSTQSAENRPSFEVVLPKGSQFRAGVLVADANGVAPSPVALRINDLDNYLLPESTVNTHYKSAVEFEPPIAINARLNNTLQYYKFVAKQGQTWDIRSYTKQIGSGLDPVIHIFNEAKKVLAGNDDSQGQHDSSLRFKVPADGSYYVRIKDYQNRIKQKFPYRIEITQATPSVVLSVKRNDRFSQRRQAAAVPRGGRFAAIMSVKKDFVTTGVMLDHGPLPDGITMTALPMRKSVAEIPVVFDADDDAPLSAALVNFSATIHNPDAENTDAKSDAGNAVHEKTAPLLNSRFEMPALFSLGYPNQTAYHLCHVDRLAVGVVERLPFSIDVVPLKAPLVRNGSAKVKIIIRRDEGFKQAIRFQFPYRAPGVGMRHQLQASPDKNEFEYPINANGGAALGKWPFYVIANANVSGLAWTSSQLSRLEVVEPFVKIDADRVVGGREQKLLAKINLEQLVKFDGTASATLRGLPPHTQVNGPLEFDCNTASLTFEITTTEKTPFGHHKGPFVEVQIPVNGGVSTGRAGNVILQVNRPPKKPPAPVQTNPQGEKKVGQEPS